MTSVIDLIKPQLPSIARHVMTGAAAVLTTHGLLTQTQTAEFVEVGSAIVLAAIPQVWAWLNNCYQQRKLVAAAKTGNPLAPAATAAETKDAMATVKAAVAPPPPPPVNLNLNSAAIAPATLEPTA